MGVADVEANYAVVKAYQFTTLTSIQVRDKIALSFLTKVKTLSVPLYQDVLNSFVIVIVVILNEDQKLTFLNNILAIKQSFLLFFNRKIINKYQENNRLVFFFKQKCPKFTGVCSNDDYLLCLL